MDETVGREGVVELVALEVADRKGHGGMEKEEP